MLIPPFNLKSWIKENRHLLKPPVNNKVIYKDADFIIMVVGGPNSRKDFHYNEGEEFFYQLEGTIEIVVQQNGKAETLTINEGDIFLLPAKVPHNPKRGPNTVKKIMKKTDCCGFAKTVIINCTKYILILPILQRNFRVSLNAFIQALHYVPANNAGI